MSTVQTIQRVAPQRRTRVAVALAAVGVLVVLAVTAVLIFALAGKSTTGSGQPAAGSQTPYVPLIQYRGTGQPPTAAATHPVSAAPPTVGLRRAEHSYGAVP